MERKVSMNSQRAMKKNTFSYLNYMSYCPRYRSRTSRKAFKSLIRNRQIISMKQTSKEHALWLSIVQDMRNHESVGEYGFDAYISQLSLLQDTGSTLRIQYPEDLPITWVEINYQQNIINAAARVLDAARKLEFVMAGQEASAQQDEETLELSAKVSAKSATKSSERPRTKKTTRGSQSARTGINADYIFENFVQGPCNSFAYATANAIANNEAKLYNPLFIHGGSGLGKTHLLHAIGNAIASKQDGKKVLYVTSEDFTNAYIEAMSKSGSAKGDALSNFRRKYRNADILLIDDVQFLASKEKTQEEFFHTFNALFASGKQIILSSDCPASEITTMDVRLTSRFEQGMTACIARPCLETRIAILRHKRKLWKSDMISDEILEFLAKSITCSVRRLEAALIRVASYASFTHRSPSITDVRMQLRDLIRDEEKQEVSIEDIQEQVARVFGLKVTDLSSPRRTAKIAHPRQIAMYLSRRFTQMSLQSISSAFGKRDHGTVIHATRTVEQKMQKDPALRDLISRMCSTLA